MELELTGHQVAKYRSTHSFHVSGLYTSTTQESTELPESRGQAAILGEQAQEGKQPNNRERGNPACSARLLVFRMDTRRHQGCLLDTLSSRFSGKKR